MEVHLLKYRVYLLCYTTAVCLGCFENDGYFAWGTGSRTPLCCPESCRSDEDLDRCCACAALPCWEHRKLNNDFKCPETLGSIHLEILDIFGTSKLIKIDNATIQELDYSNQRLTKLPDNICDYSDSLVKLDMSNNKIKNISQIKCLVNLDSLRLDNNLITEVRNDTFSVMKNLRLLTMANNKNLKKLEPNTLDIGEQNIYISDFSQNYFDSVDITNVFMPGLFCKVNMSDGIIGDITNENDYKITTINGPGDFYGERSGLKNLFNLTSLGLEFNEFPIYVKESLHIDASYLQCDCNLFPLFSQTKEWARRYWANLDKADFICKSPESMNGVDLKIVYEKNLYVNLVCELEHCPSFCHCLDKPSENKVIVNCSDRGLSDFPEDMPIGYWNNKNLDLLLDGNQITEMPNTSFLWRLVGVDLRGNPLKVIHKGVGQALSFENIIQDGVNLFNQELDTLDEQFASMDPNKIVFGKFPVRCDCTNLWIGDWIRNSQANGRLLCSVGDRILPAELVNSELLGCVETSIPTEHFVIPILFFIALIVAVIFLGYLFRYEVYLILRNLGKDSRKGGFTTDAFISICENNEAAQHFVRYEIIKALTDKKYSIFLPLKHVVVGDRDVGVLTGAQKCRHFIIVLCDQYGSENNSVSEFNILWKQFRKDTSTNITVLNFDGLERGDIYDRRIRALTRVTRQIHFKDRTSLYIDRLMARLGPPSYNRHENLFDRGSVKRVGGVVKVRVKECDMNSLVGNDGIGKLPSAVSTAFKRNEPREDGCGCKPRFRCDAHRGRNEALEHGQLNV
ncbi:protein toll-like [Mya arenaria]|uniref:protein toll-like n=1 Tax=Mya arenaria TaxID=6604 RepID=UPI0022E62336|nr:protein toll-like [Mya arenaria]